MYRRGWRAEVKRYAAPVAFLAAVTIAVLLVRSGLRADSAPGPTTSVVATTNTTPTVVKRRQRPKYYRLRAGETLSDVALRFHTTVENLLTLNPKVKPNQLTVGQRIRIK